jgi:hypothetical protein
MFGQTQTTTVSLKACRPDRVWRAALNLLARSERALDVTMSLSRPFIAFTNHGTPRIAITRVLLRVPAA